MQASLRRLAQNMPKEAKPRTVKVAKKVVEKAEKPAKKVKDPNAPKRPLSAYMYFSSAQRATVKEENPEASFGDLGKLLGAKWKEMVEEDRKDYVAKAEADKKRYEVAKTEYESTQSKPKKAEKKAAKEEEEEEDEDSE